MSRCLLPVLLALALPGACRGDGREAPSGPRTLFLVPSGSAEAPSPHLAGAIVAHVEVAADELARARGLMGRERLDPDHGMVFLYAEERPLEFWMRNCSIPLSICFANQRGEIVRVLEMEPGIGIREDLLPRYQSGVPAIHAVEMARGWFAAKGIREGDRLSFSPSLAAIRAR